MPTREERRKELEEMIVSDKWELLRLYKEATEGSPPMRETLRDDAIIDAILDKEFPKESGES